MSPGSLPLPGTPLWYSLTVLRLSSDGPWGDAEKPARSQGPGHQSQYFTSRGTRTGYQVGIHAHRRGNKRGNPDDKKGLQPFPAYEIRLRHLQLAPSSDARMPSSPECHRSVVIIAQLRAVPPLCDNTHKIRRSTVVAAMTSPRVKVIGQYVKTTECRPSGIATELHYGIPISEGNRFSINSRPPTWNVGQSQVE